MTREKFVSGYLEKLIEKDDDIREIFDNADPEQKSKLRSKLQYSLENSYDTYAKEYFDSKGVGSYLSTLLRVGGAAADVTGTYMFWALGGAGFGIKAIGLAGKSVADMVDGYHYKRHSKTDGLSDKVKDSSYILGEGLIERAASYTPFTFGVAEMTDLFRGRSKFDKKVTNRSLSYAKQDFINYVKREEITEPKTISLANFKNKYYADKSIDEGLRKAA